ncbi:hypothetical protein ACFX1W_041336 [Malus domestica]
MANLMFDDDAFLASMETQPHSPFGVVTQNESFATNQPHATCSGNTQSSGLTSLSTTTRKKNRVVNRIQWGRGRREKLNFNRFGQAISPSDNVAKFGRYIAMLARDGGLIPIDSPDWRKIDSSKLDRVWSLVQATIDWTNPRVAGKERKSRNSYQRKHCNDARVIQTQRQALVAQWDKMENKAEEHDGNEPDRVTFSKWHTQEDLSNSQLMLNLAEGCWHLKIWKWRFVSVVKR